MKRILIIFTILFPFRILAQSETKIRTDSSIIETMYFPNFNYIAEFNTLKNNKRTYYRQYYYDTRTLQEVAVFDENENYTGISKVYSKHGKLISEINHDKGIWIMNDSNAYPFYGLESEMKIKADNLISKMYGQAF